MLSQKNNYPLIAHTVKASSDSNVAATFHLEPSHNPKAGDKSTAWFALTKAGGDVIPLGDCDCQLAVWQSGTSIATVAMKPIDAEQYKDTLELVGKPKTGEAFKPFKLSYEVTVQPGQQPGQPAATKMDASPPIGLIGGAIGVILLAGLVLIKWKK
jgi:hypothetical protein